MSAAAGGAAPPPVPRPNAHPLRVMSMNLCTDEIVLALLPPERITSVTYLARDPDSSLMARPAVKVGINHGLSEEVLRERPDLVIAGTFTTTATRGMLKRLGWPLVEVPPADTFDQIRATTRQIARAVGEEVRGEALIAAMDDDLARLARRSGPPLRIAAWDGAGFNAATGSLYDTILRTAGATNIAADPRFARGGVPDTELLLAQAPALIVQGGLLNRNSLRANTAYHPVVRRFWGRGRTLIVKPAYYICGTPAVSQAIFSLRTELFQHAAAARSPLPVTGRRL
jgi:iron complex transport system substrate-binding protein